MKKLFYLFAVIFLACTLSAGTVAINPAVRKTVILLPEKCNHGLNYAAKELTWHIEKMTGVKLQTIRNSKNIPDGAFVISLGETDFAGKYGVSGAGMKHNHARVLGDENKLIITGNDRGTNLAALLIETSATLFTVYHILENDNNIHWLWPGDLGTVIPKSDVFKFKGGDYIQGTKLKFFFWRQLWRIKPNWPSESLGAKFLNEEIIWLLRHRSNRDLSEQHYPHGFEKWPAKYLKSHPEYFNMLPDGTRRADPTNWGGQLHLISMCSSNPAFRTQIVKDWIKDFNPKLPRINVKCNDTDDRCVCDSCMAEDESPIPVATRRAKALARYKKGDRHWSEELGDVTKRRIKFYQGVMAEADRLAPEKKAKFSGLIYANGSNPPENIWLGDRFQFSFCPPMMFPWTKEKVAKYKTTWEGWFKTGAHLVIRPNFTLDGHCYPINYAEEFFDIFRFAESRNLTGSDYDSLTGMHGAQGLTLYTIARLQNSHADITFNEICNEFYSAFGAAAPFVKKYFDETAKISRSDDTISRAQGPEGGAWTKFFLFGHKLFTVEKLTALGKILDQAAAAVKDDPAALVRVKFIQIGWKNALLTAETAVAFDGFKKHGEYGEFAEKITALDNFRAENARSHAFNIGYCDVRETFQWPRTLAKMMTANTLALPIKWHFKTDPQKNGESMGYAKFDFDESKWEKIPTNAPWDKSGYGTYDGYGWYRLRFTLPQNYKGEPVLMVGSADEACDVWINGVKLLHRPYPFEGNENSWNEAFDVPFGSVVRPGENVIAIRVEDNSGQGGLTKRCFIKFVEKVDKKQNIVANPDFSQKLKHWKSRQQFGKSKISTTRFDGKSVLQFQYVSREPSRLYQNRYGVLSRVNQDAKGLIVGKKYKVMVTFRTSPDFSGKMMVFLHADTQTVRTSKSNIQMNHETPLVSWSTLSKEFIANRDFCTVYLNFAANKGKFYIADVAVVPAE